MHTWKEVFKCSSDCKKCHGCYMVFFAFVKRKGMTNCIHSLVVSDKDNITPVACRDCADVSIKMGTQINGWLQMFGGALRDTYVLALPDAESADIVHQFLDGGATWGMLRHELPGVDAFRIA